MVLAKFHQDKSGQFCTSGAIMAALSRLRYAAQSWALGNLFIIFLKMPVLPNYLVNLIGRRLFIWPNPEICHFYSEIEA